MSTTTDTPGSATRQSRLILLSRTTLARESKDFYWAAIALVADATISSKVWERFLIIVPFTSVPTKGNRALAKEVIQSQMSPGRSFLN